MRDRESSIACATDTGCQLETNVRQTGKVRFIFKVDGFVRHQQPPSRQPPPNYIQVLVAPKNRGGLSTWACWSCNQATMLDEFEGSPTILPPTPPSQRAFSCRHLNPRGRVACYTHGSNPGKRTAHRNLRKCTAPSSLPQRRKGAPAEGGAPASFPRIGLALTGSLQASGPAGPVGQSAGWQSTGKEEQRQILQDVQSVSRLAVHVAGAAKAESVIRSA